MARRTLPFPAHDAAPRAAAPFAATALLAAAALLSACSRRPSGLTASPPLEWRLVPQTTVLGERKQFFVYGQGLDSARVTGPAGVTVETGEVKPDGKVLSLYLTVGPRAEEDTSSLAGIAGRRRIRVETRDTAVTFPLRVLDEK